MRQSLIDFVERQVRSCRSVILCPPPIIAWHRISINSPAESRHSPPRVIAFPCALKSPAIRSATSDRIRSHLDDRMSRSDGRAVDGIVHLARELLAKTGPSMNCPHWSQLSRVTTGQAARRRREWRDRSRRLRRRPPKHVLERDAEVSERDISRGAGVGTNCFNTSTRWRKKRS